MGFLVLCCISSLYILNIHPLSSVSFANIFSHPVDFLFVLLMDFILLCKSFSFWYNPISLVLLLFPLPEKTCLEKCFYG